MKTIKVLVLIVLLNCLSSLSAQTTGDSPYPMIFIHGIVGSDESWKEIIDDDEDSNGYGVDLQDVYGDFHNLLSVYHAVLNAYSFTTDVLVDVVVDFPNHSYIPSADGSLFTINFETSLDVNGNLRNNNPDNGSGQSDGNRSAIVKQGYALSQMIDKVLSVTGADKVILVGHSMGGLAIREYLQSKVGSSHRWWDDTVGQN